MDLLEVWLYVGKNSIDLHVVTDNDHFVNCLIFSNPLDTVWKLTCVYGPLHAIYSQAFWDDMDPSLLLVISIVFLIRITKKGEN